MAYNILLIEDNINQANFMSSLLPDDKYNVKIISDGNVAFEYLKEPNTVPDLIIVDQHLPGKSGLEILNYFNENNYDYTFVILTGIDSLELAINALKNGAVNYISKSVDLKTKLEPIIEQAIIFGINKSEKLKLQHQLIESEERFRSFFTNLPIPTFTWKKTQDDFKLIDFNNAAKEITQGGIENYRDVSLSKLYAKKPKYIEKINRCFHKKENIKEEEVYQYQSIDKIKFLRVSYIYLPTNYVIVLSEDITKQKKQNIFLNSVFESVPNSIFIVNKDGQIVMQNKQAELLFNFTSEEINGKYVEDLIPGKFKELHQVYRSNYFDNPKNRQMGHGRDLFAQKKDGTVFPAEIGLNYMDTVEGDMVLVSIIDITERKKMEQILVSTANKLKDKNVALAKSENDLKKLNATKDKLFSIIGHDLRGPIGGLKSLLELIISGMDLKDTEHLKNILEIMQESANSTYELLENLLSWAKSQRNEIIFKPDSINIYELLEQVVDLYKNTANKKQLKLHLNIDKKLTFNVDYNMLFTVFRNLISNAIKFTPEGKNIYIKTSKLNNSCSIIVQDEGIGIKKENINKLFNIEEQFSTDGTNLEKGSGLGLVLCKEFIEKHNGTITVKSKEGKGSEFIINLPIC